MKVEELSGRAEGTKTCLLYKKNGCSAVTWGIQEQPSLSLLTLSLLTASVTRMTASMASYLVRGWIGWIGIVLSCTNCGDVGHLSTARGAVL